MKLIIEIESETFNKVFHGGLFEKDDKLIESVTEAFQNVTIIPNEEIPQMNGCFNCKHNGMRMSDFPCYDCTPQNSNWEKKGGTR